MGLDLYHFKANTERRGAPFVIEIQEGWEALLTKLSWAVSTMHKEDEHFATFAPRGLFATLMDYGIETDYRELPPLPKWSPEIGRLFQVHSDKDDWLPSLIVLDPSGTIGLPTLYVEQVGYQCNGVLRAFYDEFSPTQYVSASQLVRRIHQVTDDDEKSEFERQFLDTWDERESFVFVSW